MKNFFLILLFIFFFSCKDRENKNIPSDILPKEKMVSILKDIHLAEAKVSYVYTTSDSTNLLYNYMQQEILKKHNTDTTQYNKSYRYYSEHVKLLDEIYAQVVDSLGALESKTNSKSTNEE